MDNYTLDSSATCISISADGLYGVVGTNAGTVYLFERDIGSPIWTSQLDERVWHVASSGTGHSTIANPKGSSKQLYQFNHTDPTPVWNYTCTDPIYSIDISADGQYVVAGSGRSTLYLFNQSGPTLLWNYSLTTGSDAVQVAISSDGSYITAGTYEQVSLFHTNDCVPLWNCTLPSQVRAIDISANGTYIVASGADGTLYLFHRTEIGSPPSEISAFTSPLILLGVCLALILTRRKLFFD